jgi:hypothetical protein
MRYELIRYIDKNSRAIPSFAFRKILMSSTFPPLVYDSSMKVVQFDDLHKAVKWFMETYPKGSLEWPGTGW